MKIAIVTDLHFGARADSIHFDKYFEKYYRDIFFPDIDKRGIKSVIILGDVFDRRKYINFHMLYNCKRYFFDELRNRNLMVTALTGNHDVYYKNTNEVNSLDLLLHEYENILVCKRPTYYGHSGMSEEILLMPWITTDNMHESYTALRDTRAKVCMGHFEIAGFEMHRGQTMDHGLNENIFSGFDLVLSGHYHHKSKRGNIQYLGNPYEITWADYEDERGHHIFDTATNELEFVRNPFRMFHKIHYDDQKDIPSIDNLEGCYVKLIVVNKSDYFKFDVFVDRIQQMNPADLKIVEDFDEFSVDDVTDDEEVDIEDTITILNRYVDSVITDMDKERIKTTLKSLYVEALTMEN